ncbi:cupredoxin family copper-binding protein [Streptomyces sp. NBC_01537]|uniref:cupredoxin domain-containing protein n=1 Tax=Streptomyces sp. NBC_01537 TaxID=2903896 RepID=UPI00386E2D42
MTARLRTGIRLLLAAAVLALTGLTLLPAAPARAAATHRIAMSGYAFSPRSMTVTAGDTVVWTNDDTAPHDVKTTSGPVTIHSPMLSKGGSWSYTFTTPGTYAYVCTVHPDMTAQLIVKPAATRTPTPAPTRRTVRTPTPAMTHHSMKSMTMTPSTATSAAAPAAADSPSANPTAAAAQPAVSPQPSTGMQAASAARPLQPLLLLTGIVAGVAVLCLLLVGSRAANADAAVSSGQ